MDRRIATFSPLDVIVQRMKKRDLSPLGRLQRLNHQWLTRLESHPWIRGYEALARRAPLPIGPRTAPAIDIDSAFFLSLIFHLMVLILLGWLTLKSSPADQPGPIQVRFIEIAKQVERQPAKRSKAARRQPPPARPKKPLPLPAPKIVAEAPSKKPATFTPESVSAMIQLPTRQSSSAQAPRLEVGSAPVTAVEAFSKEELMLPKGLIHGEGTPAVAGKASAMQSPDFTPYLEMIKRRVESVWSYPEGIAGIQKVNLLFVIDPGGKVVRAEVIDSTQPELDASVLQAVRNASPFPPIPESLKDLAGWPLRIRLTVDFGLKVAR